MTCPDNKKTGWQLFCEAMLPRITLGFVLMVLTLTRIPQNIILLISGHDINKVFLIFAIIIYVHFLLAFMIISAIYWGGRMGRKTYGKDYLNIWTTKMDFLEKYVSQNGIDRLYIICIYILPNAYTIAFFVLFWFIYIAIAIE